MKNTNTKKNDRVVIGKINIDFSILLSKKQNGKQQITIRAKDNINPQNNPESYMCFVSQVMEMIGSDFAAIENTKIRTKDRDEVLRNYRVAINVLYNYQYKLYELWQESDKKEVAKKY